MHAVLIIKPLSKPAVKDKRLGTTRKAGGQTRRQMIFKTFGWFGLVRGDNAVEKMQEMFFFRKGILKY